MKLTTCRTKLQNVNLSRLSVAADVSLRTLRNIRHGRATSITTKILDKIEAGLRKVKPTGAPGPGRPRSQP